MAWEVKYLKSVEKNLRRISKHDKERIRRYLEHRVSSLDNPRQLGKSLRGQFLEFWFHQKFIRSQRIDEKMQTFIYQFSKSE